MNHAIINGRLVPGANAVLPTGDLAVQRGYGVFDFFRTLRGRPLFWDDYFDRLWRSAETMRLPLPFTRDALRAMLLELATINGIADSGMRITVTGGTSPDGYSIAVPNYVIMQQPLAVPDATLPLHLTTYAHQRQLPSVKSIDYLMAIWLRKTIADRGADDVLYHANGLITECPRANVFVLTRDGVLVTAKANVLHGITRRRVLEIAPGLVPAEERDVTLEEVQDAREIFISGTSKKLVPVTRVDGREVGDGTPGEMTRRLLAALNERIEAEIG